MKPRAYKIKDGIDEGKWCVSDGTNYGIANWLEDAHRAYKSAKAETDAIYGCKCGK